ncbi:SPT2 chromatin protein-domain-containing protein [Dipodascopsis tothii]|uniref:SPT2 chromatin protein-domain-containing protein n=1 Tax=Dipodascopsis tothii TaxID=44089 RepID=UPI0034CFA929
MMSFSQLLAQLSSSGKPASSPPTVQSQKPPLAAAKNDTQGLRNPDRAKTSEARVSTKSAGHDVGSNQTTNSRVDRLPQKNSAAQSNSKSRSNSLVSPTAQHQVATQSKRSEKIAALERKKSLLGSAIKSSSPRVSSPSRSAGLNGSGSSTTTPGVRTPSAQTSSAKSSTPSNGSATSVPRKKPNFLDIMKQAENVDAENLKVTVKVRDPKKKSEKERVAIPSKPSIAESVKTKATGSSSASSSRPKLVKDDQPSATGQSTAEKPRPRSRDSSAGGSKDRQKARKVAAPAPYAQPLPGLLKKRKRKDGYESDSSMDSFIVSDAEEDVQRPSGGRSRDVDPGYDREEIWKLFRRNGYAGSRLQDNYDDEDDMETAGFDVLHEEMRSSAVARREDEEQEALEKKRADEKKKRLGTKR